MTSLEECVLSKGSTLQTVYLVAWSLVLRQFVRTDSVCFGYSVPAKDEASFRIQSYSNNIHDSISIQDITWHFDRLQADNSGGPYASEPYPFNSGVIAVESNEHESSYHVDVAPGRWGKDILTTVR